ncbi:MAG: glycosyltransferase, partial [Proteobacteria bacterium]|nr:glycosyltransferase [Pseudomonadota bacterium]
AQISTYPIFKKVFKANLNEKNFNEFVYVSSIVSHKNHKRLIKAFIEAAKKTDKEIKLHLTLNKEELPKSVFPKNLEVEFHGTLSIDNVNDLYNSCEFAIYPSLVESFGLPLIEASNHNCKVIASDLPYVHEIIIPSLTFDPYSVESISKSILKAIETDNLPETKVLVENKLDNFIDFIISQDV